MLQKMHYKKKEWEEGKMRMRAMTNISTENYLQDPANVLDIVNMLIDI